MGELKKKVDGKYESFDKNQKKWQKEVFDAVGKYDKETVEEIDKENGRLNEALKGIAGKNAGCVEQYKKDLEKATNKAKTFYSCSSQIAASTERNIGQVQNQASAAQSQVQAFEDRIKGCEGNEGCLKSTVESIKKSDIPKRLDDLKKQAKDLTDGKKKDLLKCANVEEYKKKGEDILKKAKSCA